MSLSLPTIEFFRESEAHGFLSNFYPLSKPLTLCGKAYPTAEHAYQAAKFTYRGASEASEAYAETIRLAKTPNMAKVLASLCLAPESAYPWRVALNKPIRAALAQGIAPRADWDRVKIERMRMVLTLKFWQNAGCRAKLFATGKLFLVEASPFDGFWGAGEDGNGKNVLGWLLVEVREKLRRTRKFAGEPGAELAADEEGPGEPEETAA